MYAIVLTVRGGESGRCVCRRQQDLWRDEKGLEKEETSRDREATEVEFGGRHVVESAPFRFRGYSAFNIKPYQDFT